MRIFYHVTTEKQLDSILKTGLHPNIGPLSKLYGETESRIYLFPDETTMVDAVMNWLGENYERVYGENVVLKALCLSLPDDFPIRQPGETNYEVYSYVPVPAKYIAKVTEI